LEKSRFQKEKNVILLESFIRKTKLDIGTMIYFGDGEGAFKIVSINENEKYRKD